MAQYSFSFKPNSEHSESVAMISKTSKENKGKIIYLNENDNTEKSFEELEELLYEYAKHKQIKQSDYDELLDALENNERPEEKRLQIIYDGFKTYMKKTGEVNLKDATLEVCPLIGNYDTRECILVSGANGSGKSYWVGDYAMKWQKLFPKSPIFLLSNKPIEDEPCFNKLKKIEQIPLTQKRLIDIIGKDEFKNTSKIAEESDEEDEIDESYAPYQYFVSKTGQSLVICDDFESDGKIEKMVRTIINSILRVGRAKRVYCIIVSHTLCGGQKTKTFFTECDAFCLFSKSGISPYHLKYCLRNYTTMNENQITKIMDSNSRWVYLHKNPKYVIEQSKLWLY